MKIKFVLFLFFQFIFFNSILNSDEVEIISDNIKILENGKIIESIQTNAIIQNKGLYIKGDYSVYDKEKEIIGFEKNVIFNDKTKNISIETVKAKYNQKLDILETIGVTNIKIENKYEIISSNMFYNRRSQEIYSNRETTVKDINGNIYNLENSFQFDLNSEIITTEKTNIIDTDNNIYIFENAKINLVSKEILGKELKIDFVDNYFGIPNNDPILKGRSAVSNDKQSKIYLNNRYLKTEINDNFRSFYKNKVFN